MRQHVPTFSLLLLCAVPAHGGSWINYFDDTADRVVCESSLFGTDDQEKDYAWGDLDRDGDIDLIIVRKEPFTSSGRFRNVLLLNENGVLVDRTDEYAVAADVAGDEGFLTPTNDRDVILVDVNNDDWLDIVTCTTLMDGAPKHISHPRVYMNLGEDNGFWQGLRYEEARIPRMHESASPRFCSVAAGDIDGDGDEDLYFGDYDSGPSQIFDYNNRVLINNGSGSFTDESTSRMTEEMLLSAFGAASVIADMNNDGTLDVVKQTSLNPPQHVAIAYNGTSPEGVFVDYQIVDQNAPYFISVDDLNGDGRLDIVVVDDGSDRYYLNQGNGGDGQADFSSFTLENSNGFGGNSLIVDLNGDGHNDIIVTDVDVDISGCSRTTHVYRNRGDVPNVTFDEQFVGIDSLQGVHDAAVFDLNGDGALDMIFGYCDSTRVYMQEAPVGITFSYPDGLPGQLPPGSSVDVRFALDTIGDAKVDPSSIRMQVGVEGGDLSDVQVSADGKGVWKGTLPAVECTQRVQFRIEAATTSGITYSDPPTGTNDAIASLGLDILLRDTIEGDVSGWLVDNDPSLATGAWEAVDPLGTIYGTDLAQPDDDATNGSDNVKCWVTQNGTEGGSVGEADVDGGPTMLITPALDFDGTDGTISYARWFYDSFSVDTLETHVSNDGGASWTFVHSTTGTGSAWEITQFEIGEYVVPSDNVMVRFSTQDASDPSIVEAGIDNLEVSVVLCGTPCPGDVDGDGRVDVTDLLAVISQWGGSGGSADVDGDGYVDVADLLIVIGNWGECTGG